jgi:hypothetical protein
MTSAELAPQLLQPYHLFAATGQTSQLVGGLDP